METEKKMRDDEELISLADYIELYQLMAEVDSNFNSSNRKFQKSANDTIFLLREAINEKLRYMLDKSSKWRKKQRLLSRLKDKRLERKQRQLIKQHKKGEELSYMLQKMKEVARTIDMIDSKGNQKQESAEETNAVEEQAELQEGEVVTQLDQQETELLEEGKSSSPVLEF